MLQVGNVFFRWRDGQPLSASLVFAILISIASKSTTPTRQTDWHSRLLPTRGRASAVRRVSHRETLSRIPARCPPRTDVSHRGRSTSVPGEAAATRPGRAKSDRTAQRPSRHRKDDERVPERPRRRTHRASLNSHLEDEICSQDCAASPLLADLEKRKGTQDIAQSRPNPSRSSGSTHHPYSRCVTIKVSWLLLPTLSPALPPKSCAWRPCTQAANGICYAVDGEVTAGSPIWSAW